MKFRMEGKSIEIIDTRTESEPFVVFGVRACDAQAFDVLDRVFLADPVDTYYQNRRTHGVIVFTDVLALEDGQGGVINPADRSDKAIAMRELLTTVEDDEGFESTLTPDGTGLLIAYKK